MRIAVWHNLPMGGGKRALYEHVCGLVQRGHYVEAWCPPTAPQTYLPLSPMIKEHIRASESAPRTATTLFVDTGIPPLQKHRVRAECDGGTSQNLCGRD